MMMMMRMIIMMIIIIITTTTSDAGSVQLLPTAKPFYAVLELAKGTFFLNLRRQ